jgi:hypothetical protein
MTGGEGLALGRLVRPRAERWVRGAARLGHVATGSVYIIVGLVALLACFDARLPPVGSQGALHRVLRGDIGVLALLAIALGLAADAVWQMVRAAVDADRAGPGITGHADRVAWLGSGVIHLGLAIATFKIALGIRHSTGESGIKRWTGVAMSVPFGQWLVAAVGVVMACIGLVMLYRALTGDVDRWLNLTGLATSIQAMIMGLGRFGLGARGVVTALAGLLLVLAAVQVSPNDARGLGGTLRVIQDQRNGRVLLALIALGFIANGGLELIRARYREIRVR